VNALILIVALLFSLSSQAEELVINLPHGSHTLQTTIFLPAKSSKPYPLVIINHGKGDNDADEEPRFRASIASQFFNELGYAVALPMREGFAGSSGWERAEACDMEKTGLLQAESIESAVKYLSTLPYINPERIILVGYSYGGFASLAYASVYKNPNIKAVINFSGGISRRGGGCIWTDELLDAVTSFGKNTDTPSLWIYAENDSLFPEWLAQGMHLRYKLAGGNSALVITPPYSNDGHNLFIDPAGLKIWQDVVEFFLSKV